MWCGIPVSCSSLWRRLGGAVAGALSAFALILVGVVAPLPAAADTAVSPKSGVFTLSGRGHGHGWGMSQYGAYGAATKGLTWQQILAFYYTGTALATQSTTQQIRVWISADHDSDLHVVPASGLKVSSTGGGSYELPIGYTAWRAVRPKSTLVLQYFSSSSGSWVTDSKNTLAQGTWTFQNTAKIVKVRLTDGSYREFRGTVSVFLYGTGTRTVNRLAMEDYLKSVVPSEMPTSWHANAVRSQAVAARSFAARTKAGVASSAKWDVCDTVNCQVYKGYATTVGGTRTVHETSNGNAAVLATAGQIVKYGSEIALTQFSSANGGHSAPGSYPYLKAQPDPYDGVIKSQAWTKTLTTSAVAAAYPSVGTVKQLQVVARDGYGPYGGRVESIKIIGSTTSVTDTGSAFRFKVRTSDDQPLRSTLFTITGATGTAYETFPRRYDPAVRADLLLVNSAGNLVRYPALTGGTLGAGVVVGSGWGGFSHVVNAGDWNGDGYQDVIARTSGERLLLYRGRSSGGFSAGVDMGLRSNHTMLTSLGDFNRDRYPDLAVVNTSGNFYLVFGNGGTGFDSFTRMGSSWSGRNWLRSPGDANGDGRPDLLSLVGDTLYLHKGTSTSFSYPVSVSTGSVSTGWSAFSSITSIGDFDGDKKADIVARDPQGKFVLFSGDGTGKFPVRKTLSGTWTGTRFAI